MMPFQVLGMWLRGIFSLVLLGGAIAAFVAVVCESSHDDCGNQRGGWIVEAGG